mmetsp:Transcript_12463/g.27540  ORF Transcript_12463/g.27540 Transcript_12463/m.27540 type:complete len:152 (-) Transcript_12463:76-531(-)|eukprot:CAMPEP_0204318668 /NCGR_PEP_ID=MMETSP0469-20131031/6668_1 /ASSEMBLY_ACC=CAM_ASM_000384 /TAXON_ID=2969 /ORGANISM="Oxyrrhis marina" /LENGTH=151 /DNA_ID=CAMNT_0051299749 /DNA_START=51 /DNA_END=506 /DNA_ORIENTATION=+
MGVNFFLLISRQGKTRLAKYFVPISQKDRMKQIKEVTHMVLHRNQKQSNFIEYRDQRVIYKRYASLYFVAGVDVDDNELLVLEIIHHFVEILDRYFGNVCELDLIFNFHKAYYILDELLICGELQETSKKVILRMIQEQDSMMQEKKDGKS